MRETPIGRRTFLKGMLGTAGGVLIGSVGYGYQSSLMDVSRERLILPNCTRKLRIVALSDLHAPCFYNSIPGLVDTINAEAPDVFVLAGDIIDNRGNEYLVEMFNEVEARFAKVAVLGNWEYFGELDLVKLKTNYINAGVSLLVNDIFEAQDLMIVGLDDIVFGSPDNKILKDCSSSKCPVLVISHCPECFDSLSSFSDSPLIVISGHTHGGQIAPFGIVFVTPNGSGPYVHGWYHTEKDHMYVMRGIGTTPGVPLRIGARPEVLVLDLVGTAGL